MARAANRNNGGTTNGSHRAIAVGTLVVDERFREVNKKRSKAISDNLDLDGLGVFTISERPDGRLIVLDGQHRREALVEHGMEEWEVDCLVFSGLTEADEARRFRVLNDNRKPTALDDFRAGLEAADPKCLAITAIVESHGLTIERYHADGTVAAVRVLQSVFEQTSEAYQRGEVLDKALGLTTEAWGTTAAATEGQIIAAFGAIVHKYGEEIEYDALVKKLAKFPGGPSALIGHARSLSHIKPGTVPRLVAGIMVERYNLGRRIRLAAL